ncbi:rhodanese-like domain-containing protein [Romboutsia weinsteinii]|uniref:Rhodanese-like domain-containing protein n=1 Tax=Romboutsia weinsteinii TaxID=2020949 RepID=A0A371J0Z8_9FIRM|nr:rhodanese-like domain-containing protein [Romboutsia weinsteinii]RDY26348.1 rhodanese-like domain-containing protein [Romboutsia weinsteinii]
MKINKKFKVLSVGMLLVLSLGVIGCSSKGEEGYSEIDAAKTEELVGENEKTLVIDVRDSEKYAAGHLADAINIPFDEFEARIDELAGYENQNIVLICNTGNKSGKAAKMLVDKGFKKVNNAQDGMEEHDYKTVTYNNVTGGAFEKLASENKNAVVVDVRDAKDYDKSHIENSINIPIDDFEAKFNELDEYKDKDILIYCSIGRRSAKAAGILTENGYEKATNSVDGVKEYEFKLSK